MIDWSLLTMLLRKHYKNLSQVGKEVGSDWQHINRLARGDVIQPKFDLGIKLLNLGHDHIPSEKFKKVLLNNGRGFK